MLKQEENWLLKEKYEDEKCPAFFAEVEKLKKGIPLAYLIGNMPFLNCHIDLKYKPLIPRSETEFWLNNFINNEINKNQKYKILDLFSGSGCIGIGILRNCSNCQIDFGEKNPNFIKQIKKNIKLNEIDKKRYQVFQTDIFSKIPKKKYNFILTNPPYISKKKKNTVQKSVLDNEDYNALFAKDNGLFFIKKIIEDGFKYLEPKGKIYIEFDSWQKELLEKYLLNMKLKFAFQKDQYDKNRVLILST